MRHKHLITLMPFQTRLPEQILTTKQRLYAPYLGRPRHQVANHSLLLRDDNPNRYGKLDRSDKTQSNFSKCRLWNSQTKHIPLAVACFRGQKSHSRLSNNILTVRCTFASRHFLCKGLQLWSLPAHCLFNVSSLPLKSFKPSGSIHRWRLTVEDCFKTCYLTMYLSI